MSNERIDLTQFEGITKQGLALRGMIYVGDGASVECGLDDPRCQTIDIGMVARMNEDRLGYVDPDYAEKQWSKALATARLFSEAPNLLAELKRCYEQLDSQNETISELIESNTVKGEILDELRVCDECGEGWDYHPSGADCEADRQQASE